MKLILYFILFVFTIVGSAMIADKVFFADNAIAENMAIVASTDAPGTKASLSSDLKIQYENDQIGTEQVGNFFADNWGKLFFGLLAFADVVVRLTPSMKDNSILTFITNLANYLIPNRRKGGGTF